MTNNTVPPPWIKNKTTRNIAKRARAAAILKRIEREKDAEKIRAEAHKPPVAR